MAEYPAARQLRLLQTLVEAAAENSTLVLPVPVDLLRFLERATLQPSRRPCPTRTPASTPRAGPAGNPASGRDPTRPDLAATNGAGTALSMTVNPYVASRHSTREGLGK